MHSISSVEIVFNCIAKSWCAASVKLCQFRLVPEGISASSLRQVQKEKRKELKAGVSTKGAAVGQPLITIGESSSAVERQEPVKVATSQVLQFHVIYDIQKICLPLINYLPVDSRVMARKSGHHE